MTKSATGWNKPGGERARCDTCGEADISGHHFPSYAGANGKEEEEEEEEEHLLLFELLLLLFELLFRQLLLLLDLLLFVAPLLRHGL